MSQYANEGVVSTVSAKDWYDNKKGRNIVLYSFQLQGSNRWFRTGEDELPFREGDYVRFTNDAKANVAVSSIEVGNAPAGASTSAPAGQGGNRPARNAGGSRAPANRTSGQSKDGYWTEREQRDLEKDKRYLEQDIPRMCFTTAQDRAVNLVTAALEFDCLSFGNMAKGAKLDALLDYVDLVTDRFVKQTMQSPQHVAALLEERPQAQESEGPEGYDYDEG